ncbi:hypothetical protein [Bradyrhizobium sp. CCBAU 51765]|uniref:hypothetical protein n=1 Tax=Bradyrhizobium sp. CCBAU 51765 TaxID=1325102 RepID=UPI001889BDD4|nr:hypothetical protein [Bradyrhizobium sp. CCBAU 51765]
MGIAVQWDRAEVGDAGLDPGVEGEGSFPLGFRYFAVARIAPGCTPIPPAW